MITMKACIIIPTYNEKENIGGLLEELLEGFKKIKNFDMSILVVDDNSPDGTQEIVKKYLDSKQIFMLTGEKNGLGSAYIKGFNYVLDKLKADVLFEMDADFSHKPEDVPKFLKEIENGYDFVIGSRYISGGEIPDWGFIRKSISSGGNFFARIVAGLYTVHDCTSGFRAIRTDLIKQIKLDKLEVEGYAFQMNLLHNAIKLGAKIKEIPIVFNDRNLGTSKMRLKDLREFFFNSFKLRFKK
ncbi:MAG: dolichyl-phosphate beta-D-mannosyltransferase [Nanoarchaeota archaeon]|nr:dolichyl-phosphate beta-D-mannosyltransferase [Nanoarchaeota archaeon]